MADVQSSVERLDVSLRSLGELATHDHLTGTLNRRAGEERLAQDVARAEREAAPPGATLTLAVADLDQFKPVNDRHGHDAGDACLKHFAGVLARNVRKGDWIARWGGDEFVVGVWEAQGRGAQRVLDRVGRELRAAPLTLVGGQEVRLTFSAGVAEWRPGDDVRGLFRRADEALYRAKEGGRNAVVHAD
jgi:diguanylate cyclase (GGDEF)-like protein